MERYLSDCPVIPRTYRYLNKFHLNSIQSQITFGKTMGAALKRVKPKRYEDIFTGWRKYVESKGENPSEEWHIYLANYLIYGVLPEEYSCYGFHDLNDRQKREFVTDLSRVNIYKKCNDQNYVHFFSNKYETYLEFKEFYQREALLINRSCSFSQFRDFVKRHNCFVVKPLRLYLGMGIHMVDMNHVESEEKEFKRICSLGECIIEEVIRQSSAMSIFHPESVNTIRIPAFMTKQGLAIRRPFFKCGCGSSVVDNGGAGGIFVGIDAESGILITDGIDEKNHRYIVHPDSQIRFKGYQLPEWEHVPTLINACMKIIPQVKYVGWDLAHTDQGWVIVEGNHTGQFVGQQMPLKQGCAREIEQILERM